jgi:hypothetical protein
MATMARSKSETAAAPLPCSAARLAIASSTPLTSDAVSPKLLILPMPPPPLKSELP